MSPDTTSEHPKNARARNTDDDPPATRSRRSTVIVPCPDGPLLVRGDVDIRTPSGECIPQRRRTVALCRCGATGIPPFCDGSHKVVGFTTSR